VNNASKGKVRFCIISGYDQTKSRAPLFFQRKDGTIVANIEGFAIISLAEFDRLKTAAKEPLDAASKKHFRKYLKPAKEKP